MAKQTINIGLQANDRQGDPLRTSFEKINANFTELYLNQNTSNIDLNGNIISSNTGITLSTNNGDNIWDFGIDGIFKLSASSVNSSNIFAEVETYPMLLAYGTDHGGPELNWMNSANTSAISDSTVLRNTLYINDGGFYIGMNENNTAGSFSGAWRFDETGKVHFPGNNLSIPAEQSLNIVTSKNYTVGSLLFTHASGTQNINTILSGNSVGTGSATYEWWFRYDNYVGTQGMLQTRTGGIDNDGFDVSITDSGLIEITTTGTSIFTSSSTVPINTWTHIAVVRNGSTTWTVYVNGSIIGTFNFTNTTSEEIYIGWKDADFVFSGNISNFRYCKSAVYTSNFIPTTEPLTRTSQGASNCILLLNTATVDTAFVDSSTNAYIMNVVDNPTFSITGPGLLGHIDSSWTFNKEGSISIPGNLVQSTIPKSYVSSTIELDLSKSINKILPTIGNSGGDYHLNDGVEGQIMYIVPATEMTSGEYTTMSFSNARWHSGQSIIQGATNYWLPFSGSFGGPTASSIITLIFTDGCWNLPHNYFD